MTTYLPPNFQNVKKIRIIRSIWHPVHMPYQSMFFNLALFNEPEPKNPMAIHMPDFYTECLSFN